MTAQCKPNSLIQLILQADDQIPVAIMAIGKAEFKHTMPKVLGVYVVIQQ